MGYWVSKDNTNPQWIKFDLDNIYLLKKLKILQAPGTADRMKSISVRFSDSITFDRDLEAVSTWIEVNIPNVTHSSFVEITGNSNYHGGNYNAKGMSEIEIFGCNPGIQIL